MGNKMVAKAQKMANEILKGAFRLGNVALN
jgi:hypothetical protein